MGQKTVPTTAAVAMTREVMDIREAADYLGVSQDSLRQYTDDGIVPAFRLGNRWKFKRSCLDDWMVASTKAEQRKRKAGKK